jgi:hypothetical protein
MKTKIAFALIMGIITTGIISFTLISINIGFTEKFLKIWIRSWGIAYLVAVPAILIIAPMIERLVKRLFAEK